MQRFCNVREKLFYNNENLTIIVIRMGESLDAIQNIAQHVAKILDVFEIYWIMLDGICSNKIIFFLYESK